MVETEGRGKESVREEGMGDTLEGSVGEEQGEIEIKGEREAEDSKLKVGRGRGEENLFTYTCILLSLQVCLRQASPTCLCVCRAIIHTVTSESLSIIQTICFYSTPVCMY